MVSDYFRGIFPLGMAAGIIAFILISPVTAQTYNNTQPFNKNPRLDSILSQLISADDPKDFALSHNLYIQDGNVRIVIELSDETGSLPDYVIEETRYQNKVQALVPAGKIEELSGMTYVTFIRAPLKPYADTAAIIPAATTKPPEKSGFNSGILIIFSIVLIVFIKKIRMW